MSDTSQDSKGGADLKVAAVNVVVVEHAAEAGYEHQRVQLGSGLLNGGPLLIVKSVSDSGEAVGSVQYESTVFFPDEVVDFLHVVLVVLLCLVD